MKRFPRMAAAFLLTVAILAAPAAALINPNYTPADLVASAEAVYVLEVSAPADHTMTARVVEVLKGPAPEAGELTLDLRRTARPVVGNVTRAFGDLPRAPAMMFLGDHSEAAPDADLDLFGPEASDDRSEAVVQIGLHWFALSDGPRRWQVGEDTLDMAAVWAGSATMLRRAVRYALDDDRADFPVHAMMQWRGEEALGKVDAARGAMPVEGLGGDGRGVLVLAEGGDRLILAGDGERPPHDATDAAGLTTASRLAAVGDFSGNGRLDIAAWDGGQLHLAVQSARRTFTEREAAMTGPALEGCHYLATIDTGGTASLLAGTPDGPVLLHNDGSGRFEARPLQAGAARAELGRSLHCIVADFNGDGRPDLLEVLEGGIALWPGRGDGRFSEPRVMQRTIPNPPHSAVVADFDADGLLDVLLVGANGGLMLAGGDERSVSDITAASGELAYHGLANEPAIISAALADINSDGRPGAVLFYPNRSPMLFFNRGFACFGLAMHMILQSGRGQAATALAAGQSVATAADLTGNGSADLLAVDRDGRVWAILTEPDRRPTTLTVALEPGAAGPVTVRVNTAGRDLGAWHVQAGGPARIGLPQRGPVTLEWTGPDGTPHTRDLIVVRDMRSQIVP